MMRRLAVLLCLFSFALTACADELFFVENRGSQPFVPTSWGFYNGSSTLKLADDFGEGTGKWPIEESRSFKGRHSLLLHWTSGLDGDWGVAIAGPNWQSRDLTTCTALQFRINGPAAMRRNSLPDIALEDTLNHKSSRAWMGDYADGLDADSGTWQEVTIPMAAFQPGIDQCNMADIKTVYLIQRLPDGTGREMWIDDLRAVRPGSELPTPTAPAGLTATGQHLCIDLEWEARAEPGTIGYNIYRAPSADGPFVRINAHAHETRLFSDFVGTNGVTYFYTVTTVNSDFDESPASGKVSASGREMSDEELLTTVQRAAFRYFFYFGHPVSGLAREGSDTGDTCAIGGTGFGLFTLMVGAERGFAGREDIAAFIVKMLRFIRGKTTRYHGAWSHHVHGATGSTIPFSELDDGGDLVETAYLCQGLLAIRQYFDRGTPDEIELRSLATELWEGVDWNWYRKTPDGDVLFWHWSPKNEWELNHPVRGFNECMITYLLAAASPTHPIPASLYTNGWANDYWYENGNSYYGHKIWVGPAYGGPLFFTHYSFLGFDPRNWRDAFCNYFENNRNITLVNRAYCMENPKGFKDYGPLVWGLTASRNPFGYGGHAPDNDNGTITPTAAISAMPYTPQESIATLRHFYEQYGARLWGEFGFYDAFNPQEDWVSDGVLAIDQGTIAPMIENYRSGLCWKMFMANPEIPRMLEATGWRKEPPSEGGTAE